MQSGKIILVLGGARSGKSSFANNLACSMSKKVLYVATAECLDKEMSLRVKLHKKHRNKNWLTIEEPRSLAKLKTNLIKKEGIILFECLTLFVSNLACDNIKEKVIISEIKGFLTFLKNENRSAIFVSNEVGSGIVPDNAMARDFRDIQGRVNQLVAGLADEVYLVVAGIGMKIK